VFSNKGENLTLDNSILDAADVSPYDTGRDNIGRDSGITDAGLSTEKRYINTRSYYRKENAASPPRDERQHAQFAK
jgi:hypothetical protein